MKKRYVVSALVLIITVTVATFIIIDYLDPAKALYVEGKKLGANGDYGAAVDKYQTLVDKFPDSSYAGEAKGKLLAESYYNWGLALGNEQKYGEAAEKYQMALTYPESKVFDASEVAVLDCYYAWGQYLQGEKNYSGTLEKYQAIIEIDKYYPNWSSSVAEETIPECYYQWGQYLQSQKNFSGAMEKYQFIVDTNAFSNQYQSQAKEAIPSCYYEWVSQLVTAKEYDEAIQEYRIILEKYPLTVWASSEKANVLKDVPADVLFTSATKLQQEKSYDIAIRLYETLLQFNPGTQYASQAEEAKIDTEIAKIAEQEHGYLPPPPVIAQGELKGKAELTIVNDTPYQLTIFLSGPITKSIIIQASPDSYVRSSPPSSIFSPDSIFYHAPQPPESAKRETITLESGTYKMAAKVDDPGTNPFYGELTLIGDNEYQDWLYLIRG